jgi:hypothetical protein
MIGDDKMPMMNGIEGTKIQPNFHKELKINDI